jgi:glutathione peroxidase
MNLIKSFLNLLVVLTFFTGVSAMSQVNNFFELSAPGIDGKPESLAKYKGKAVLVVNTASECGFTPQYKGLQALYNKYKDKGLVVLGFPSNDFGAQEPGSNADIKKFCEMKFHVTFPLFSKDVVKGPKKQPVYSFLTQGGDEVAWNFEKFLIDPSGKMVARYKSKVDPEAPELTSKIESMLK